MTECVFCGSEEAYPSQYGTFCIPCATIVGEIVETINHHQRAERSKTFLRSLSPGRRNPAGMIPRYSKDAEDFEATNLRSLEETEKRFGKDLAKYVHTLSMGAKVEPSHFCECGNELTIYPRWNVAESHKLGKESLMAECEKCGWTGVVQRAAGTFDAESFEAINIEVREMPQLSARDVELAKMIAIYYQEMEELFESGELTKAIEKEIDEAIENIFSQMSPEAQNPWGAETFEAPLIGKGAVMDIGKNTDLGAFTTSELTTSSAIHGDFEEASLGYSGHQNIAVRKAETIDSPSSTIPSWATQSLLVDALVVITGLGLGFFGVRELKKKELAWLVL